MPKHYWITHDSSRTLLTGRKCHNRSAAVMEIEAECYALHQKTGSVPGRTFYITEVFEMDKPVIISREQMRCYAVKRGTQTHIYCESVGGGGLMPETNAAQ